MTSTSIWQPRSYVLGNVNSRWPGRLSSWRPLDLGCALENLGFRPHYGLEGGRFAIAVAGLWGATPAVARIDPDPSCYRSFTASRILAESDASPSVLYSNAATGVQVLARVTPGTSALVRPINPPSLGELLTRLRYGKSNEHLLSLSNFLTPRISKDRSSDSAKGSAIATVKERKEALTLLSQLNGETGLMHGDCSRGNLLLGSTRWWLIDPRGVSGDWQFDVAVAALKCRYSVRESKALVSETGADAETVAAWSRVARAARV